mmetsp:Transcript_26570/g.42581  ORF Transcript_26570/g.42581 Transcript_26570/m.42581 type:complete len:81 (-) Transcript_26570:573-815(-)
MIVPSEESARRRAPDAEESMPGGPDSSVMADGGTGRTDLTLLGSTDIFLVETVGELSGVLLRLGSLPGGCRALATLSSSP